MLKRVIHLRNIGRFKNLSAKADVTFRRLTLVYGLNGHGKTTLTGVLRSLATGDRAYVDERATLGAAGHPSCEILLDSGKVLFTNGSWSGTAPNIEIFDTTFVNDNVFTGDHVDSDHRKNLYEVVVGSAGVALVREIDRLDSEGRQTASAINDAEKRLSALIQAPFSTKDFLELKPQADLSEKIAERTAQLSAVRKQKDVLARPQLDSLVVPVVPQAALAVCAKSVAQISEAAEAKVRNHLQHFDKRGEGWIRQGLEYVRREEQCPFCTQDLKGVDIVSLYRDFFSNTYREHLVEIERASNSLEQTLGDDALQLLQKRVATNDARIQGWNDLADLRDAAYVAEPLEAAWRHLRQVLRERLRQKTANPSESVSEDPQLTAAVRDYQSAADGVRRHNDAIAAANRRIGELKQQAAATKPESLEEELRKLRNTQIRHEPSTQAIIDELQAARERKKKLDSAKTAKKEELGKVSTAVLEKYQGAINRLLQNFGANFTIVNTRPVFPGGKASSTYQLELNGTVLDIGDANTPRGKPCFRTALSTGDKSTLALAFFLARLEQDDLSNKCVVIDDPLSSFDSFRTACTQQEVAGVAARALQTIVLSHDALFLKGVFDRVDRAATKCLQVVREGDTHVLREWAIADYFLKEAHGDYFLLKSYLEDGPPQGGDLKAVASAIRTFVEGHLRHRFPGEFPENEWLGGFIQKAREAKQGPLAGLSPKLPELEAINDYSKAFHHSSAKPVPNPTDVELRPWVARTLKFVQGG